jgi:Subtilase family
MKTSSKLYLRRRILALTILGWVANSSSLAAGDSMESALELQSITTQAAAQINAILTEKAQRTPVEGKLDSNLLYGMRAVNNKLAGSTQVQPAYVQSFIETHVATDNMVKVKILGSISDDLLTALADLGASEINPVAQYDTVTAQVPITALLGIAQRADVRFVDLADPGTTQRYDPSPEQLKVLDAIPKSDAIGNVVYPANVIAHGADLVQQAGILGSGVKVCVLSDGVTSLTSEVAAGRLPAGVDVVSGQEGWGDEGTAMLEIIHQMAPSATLGFATARLSDVSMAANIIALRNAPHNCDIIVDDYTYFLEPAFQDGIIAKAVNTVVASGALYFSSAANSGSLKKGSSGTWEGDYVVGGTANSLFLGESGKVHSWGSSIYNTLTATTTSWRVLNWSDPMGASSNDYDLFVISADKSTVLAHSTNLQTGTQNPQETIPLANQPVNSHFVVLNYGGLAAPRALRLDTERGRLLINTHGNTFGHNAASNAITTAAVNVSTAGGGIFTGGVANPVTTYSSDGPRQIFYDADGAAIKSGNLLFGTSGGSTLHKVDIAAADCVLTGPDAGYSGMYNGVYGTFPHVFCGTSAAAPHAAAIAALMKSAKPSLAAGSIKIYMDLLSTLDIEAAGYDENAGFGLLMANAAVKSFLTPIASTTSFFPPTVHRNAGSTLSISLGNTNAVALKNIGFTSNYPANLTNSSRPNALISGAGCTGGTVTATANGNSLVVSGLTIPAGATCTVTVVVKSATAGHYANSAGSVTTPFGLTGTGLGATLTVDSRGSSSIAPVLMLLLN